MPGQTQIVTRHVRGHLVFVSIEPDGSEIYVPVIPRWHPEGRVRDVPRRRDAGGRRPD